MEENKYLNEEKYQQTVGKMKKAGKIILIIGIIISVVGSAMAITGFVSLASKVSSGAEGVFNTISDYSDNDYRIKKYNSDESFEDRYNSTIDEYNDYLDSYYESQKNVTDNLKDTTSNMGLFIALFIIGLCISGLGFPMIIVGGILLLVAHNREIKAFAAQSTIPVAKEVVDDVTPTVSKAVGSVAKEVSKGIKEGIEEANNENGE